MHMSEILKAELDAFRERTEKTRLDILETGTIRGAGENYHRGDGWSTATFAEYVKANGGTVVNNYNLTYTGMSANEGSVSDALRMHQLLYG